MFSTVISFSTGSTVKQVFTQVYETLRKQHTPVADSANFKHNQCLVVPEYQSNQKTYCSNESNNATVTDDL
jgi:hypothetical protein